MIQLFSDVGFYRPCLSLNWLLPFPAVTSLHLRSLICKTDHNPTYVIGFGEESWIHTVNYKQCLERRRNVKKYWPLLSRPLGISPSWSRLTQIYSISTDTTYLWYQSSSMLCRYTIKPSCPPQVGERSSVHLALEDLTGLELLLPFLNYPQSNI